MKRERLTIAVDIDGTLMTNSFPYIGGWSPHALNVIRRLQSAGHQIVLWSVRTGHYMEAVVVALREEGIIGIWANEIPTNPLGSDWGIPGFTTVKVGPKVNCDIFIDDRSLGTQMVQTMSGEFVVDWLWVESELVKQGVLR
jgi:hypothetical protein